MNIFIYRIDPISGGEETELYTEITSGENFERRKFTVSAEMFFELELPLTLSSPLEISREKYDVIASFSSGHAAVKKGINILSFSDNTKKGLVKKLVTKGFSREASEYAADFLERSGYINESNSACMLAKDMALKKLYGPKRIAAALFEKGFSREAIDAAAEETDVDFSAICRVRIEKMGGREIFADKDEKKKAVAALLRYGFSYDDIKEALRRKA